MADASDIRASPTPSELLAREAEGRNRAGITALAAAIFAMFAFLVNQVISGKAPSITITAALRDAAGEGNPKHGLLADWIVYQHDKFGLLSLQALLEIVGVIAFAIVLAYLLDAAKGRRPEMPAWVRYLLYGSVAITVIGTLIYTIGNELSYSDFVGSANQSTQAARDARSSGASNIGGLLIELGRLGVIISWVLISLNAMRVGLLTRFLGFLGILGGVLTYFLAQLPIIQIFWLIAVGLTILQRMVNVPPAWITGQAEPWPTQQQAREARAQAAEGKSKPAPKSKPAAKAAPVSRKRKRRG